MRLSRKQIIFIIFILIITGGLFSVFKRGLFNISKIEVLAKDLSCATIDQLKETSSFLGQNFFLIDYFKTEETLKKKFICIKSVVLSKNFPNSVKLEAIPRQPFVQLVTLNNEITATPSAEDVKNTSIIDDEGVAFAITLDGVNIPRVYVPSGIDIKIPDMLRILQKLKAYKFDLSEAYVKQDDFIVSGQPKLIFRLNDKIDAQLASLQLILNEAKINESSLEFIDLRFDKPVVKFAPKKNG